MSDSAVLNRKGVLDVADKDGQFRRQTSQFRNFVTPDSNSAFPPEKDRYALYIHLGCPWAHRTSIVRTLKGLDDIIQLIVLDAMDPAKSWYFSGDGEVGPKKDPLYGFKYLREFYEKVDPHYDGRVTVPMLWDKKKETIVSNESSDIIRMFYTAFDGLLPPEKREETKGEAGLLPKSLQPAIEEMNQWVYDFISNGVYKTGFASTQEAYEEHIYPLFESLDRVEEHLGQPGHQPYLFGEHITDADIRLYTAIIRFDVAYHTLFRCNLKMIRHDYPRMYEWLRRLYWDESERTNGAFKNTLRFDVIKKGYASASRSKVVPVGPVPNIHHL
ncbi:hypothetical protein B0A49_01180 [Cryomyces minteri]|uniref:GST C-terminal domain-containing protein n=2 Tax=Cryomyces minteri TaxID=331657 RepID=A0A4U0XPD9_9PEZI|nr:hypothetical protein B0A49_05866 [Cryomyces minteri]TKA76735.1 hypothetical protein B0A49_01180 [Cryomyces minteri]